MGPSGVLRMLFLFQKTYFSVCPGRSNTSGVDESVLHLSFAVRSVERVFDDIVYWEDPVSSCC